MALSIYSGGSRLAQAQNALKRERSKAREATESLIETAMSAGSAFGVGYLEAKYPAAFGPGAAFGFDTSLLIGIVGVGLGATGVIKDKQMARYAEALGIGALAAYAAKQGRDMANKP